MRSTTTHLVKEARNDTRHVPAPTDAFSFESRCRIVQLVLAGKSPQAAAAACGASRATGYRLWDRFQQGGWAALVDRPSTPKRQPRRLPPEAEAEILAARERSGYGPLRLAAILERPASTIGKVLRRLGCSRLPKPERDPIVRYERARPGELAPELQERICACRRETGWGPRGARRQLADQLLDACANSVSNSSRVSSRPRQRAR